MENTIKIKKEFAQQIITFDYLYSQYKNELTRINSGYSTQYRGTRSARLKRLRVEMNNILMEVERNYNTSYHEEIPEDEIVKK